MKIYQPVTIEHMRQTVDEKTSHADTEEDVQCQVAVVLGPDFPDEVAKLYCDFSFKKGVTITCIPCTDPRAEAIGRGEYKGAPTGVLIAGGCPQQVFLLSHEYAMEFDRIETVNFFDHQGGIVCAMCFNIEEVDRALEWGV